MPIKLACVSTAANTDAALHELVRQSAGEVELVLHLGSTKADFKASSLSRMNLRRGRRGHLLEGTRHSGLAHALFMQPEYDALADDFIDHLHRRAEPYAHLPHPLRGFHEYWDYFHVLADVVAQRLADSGATHLLLFNVPHLVHDTLVYQVARSLGLPVLILTQSLFPDRFLSLGAVEDYGRLALPLDADARHAIDRAQQLEHFYMKGIAQAKAPPGRLSARAYAQWLAFLALKRPGRALNPAYSLGLLRRMRAVAAALPDWRDPFARFFHEDELAYFEHLVAHEDTVPDLSRRFVYFALQLQPEMTTSALGGPFKDQALAIESLARLLPDDVAIYVKENPKQGAYMRGPMFFHRLKRIPNLVFMPSHASTHELTARAEFVATISGTVGWEAVRQGKPALVYGPTWYASLPGVHTWREDLRYESIVGTPVDHDRLERSVGTLLARAHRGVIERHYRTLVSDFDETANTRRVAEAALALLTGRAPTTFA